MNKTDIIDFFDKCAPSWDAEMIRNDAVIDRILDYGGIHEGCHVLDVACGTGVLFPDYLKREVGSITGVDISSKMIQIAQSKFTQENITLLCADIETVDLGKSFDACMVYNAFPHFPNPENLIKVLHEKLKPHGRLSIAHGMSRAAIDQHHSGGAKHISAGLMDEHALAQLMAPYFQVDIIISNDHMYQVSGTKR